jgi:hypothetical protein
MKNINFEKMFLALVPLTLLVGFLEMAEMVPSGLVFVPGVFAVLIVMAIALIE